MTTIAEVIEHKRAAAGSALIERNALADTLAKIAKQHPRGLTNPAEIAQVGDIRARKQRLDAQLDDLEREIADLEQAQAEDDEVARLQSIHFPTDAGRARVDSHDRTQNVTTIRVGNEPGIYTRDPHGPSFFADLMNRHNDPAAAERLARHQSAHTPQERAIGTGAVVGLVPPEYLTDLVAPLARNTRPLANAVRALPLPDTGMTVNISRVTTGTSADVQATENSAVSETDADDTLLTINVRTIAGQQTLSRQAVDRGQGADTVIMEDLIAAYHAKLDSQIIAADGTSGTHLGVLSTSGTVSVTYTDASPTVAEVWPKIADAIQQVNAQRHLPPDLIVMHPRRWGWFNAALDTAGRPLIVPTADIAMNSMGIGDAAAVEGAVGTLQGLPVITDSNIPVNLGAGTNEDRIIVCRREDLILWEDTQGAPFMIRAEDVKAANLGVLFVAAGYSAFTAGRYPTATAVIAGTGLATPSF